MTPRISPERLLGDLRALARIGGRPDGGVDRVDGSAADLEARAWLGDRLRDAGMSPWVDPAGNVFGRLEGGAGPWLLLGSHTDTVPAGGRLDGAYGVIAALEVARALIEAGHPGATRLEVVSFADEEGAVAGGGMRGSRHLCGSPHAGELSGYLELHIEQGPRLEAAGIDLAVVEGIVGIDRWDVTIRGASNHAGTTPPALRRDAGAVAGRLMWRLSELLASVDPEMVGNVGVATLLPGAANVVPGEARLVVELRALAPPSLDAAASAVRAELEAACAERGCGFDMEARSRIAPSPMAPAFRAAAERAVGRIGVPLAKLVSGAGHDAGELARVVPAVMLFVPSRAGVSHSPLEHTDDRQLVLGAQALLQTTIECLEITSTG